MGVGFQFFGAQNDGLEWYRYAKINKFVAPLDLWILPDLSISTGQVEVTSLLRSLLK